MDGSATAPRVGILGGGQLGLMLAQASAEVPSDCVVMDADPDAPASQVVPVSVGDVASAADVLRFGRGCDIVTIEVEAVSSEGLDQLVKTGVQVFPQPHLVARIQDKGLQKEWLCKAGFPTSSFRLFDDADSVRAAVGDGELSLPFVQKTRRAGYDGRGVAVIQASSQLNDLLEAPCLVEERVDIAQELSVIVVRAVDGELAVYDPVEMCFRENANILDLLVCPARVSAELAERAQGLARDIASQLEIVGTLAVEMFVDRAGELWINELAPRPHNSGHHTIEVCETSQYAQHLRAITGQALGSTERRGAGVLLNLLGKDGHRGAPRYDELDALGQRSGVHVHVYGKQQTWPMRKMGHVTIVDEDVNAALAVAAELRPWLEIVSR